MADSSITKQALATALEELLEKNSFKKISVADICERCGMSRKSFYYHFKDKFDLVNWIFDTGVTAILQTQPNDYWDMTEKLCQYLYDNRNFYRKVFQVQGQNSLPEHFRELFLPLLRDRIDEIIGPGDAHQICVGFIADGFVCGILRWLLDKNCIPPKQFVAISRRFVEGAALSVYEDMKQG